VGLALPPPVVVFTPRPGTAAQPWSGLAGGGVLQSPGGGLTTGGGVVTTGGGVVTTGGGVVTTGGGVVTTGGGSLSSSSSSPLPPEGGVSVGAVLLVPPFPLPTSSGLVGSMSP